METVAPPTPFEPAPGAGLAPPQPVLAAPANVTVPSGGVLYKVDSSRATFGELWRDSRPSTAWLAWIAKLLRTRLPGSVNDPNVESLRPFEVDDSAVPPDVRARRADAPRPAVARVRCRPADLPCDHRLVQQQPDVVLFPPAP